MKKDDEFYTLLSDIEAELKHYKSYFKGKKIFCNCDDYRQSKFFDFFKNNFHEYGVSELHLTHYNPCVNNSPLSPNKNDEKAFHYSFNGYSETITPLKGNGDFRSNECVEILKKCDVIVTNPPFSLFREFIKLLFKHDKKFLIIGNMNAAKYKDVFPRIKNDEVRMGVNIRVMYFAVPDCGDEKNINARWFTNIPHGNAREFIPLNKKYNEADYPRYDNYDAIEVSKVRDIPVDYKGIMGVPITFLDKYNSEQFELIACSDRSGDGLADDIKIPHERHGVVVLNGKVVYTRFFIRHKK